MNRSETIGKLVAALAKAQGQMGKIGKDGKNGHFKSRYATLASVIEALKKPLSSHGLAFFQDCECTNSESGGGIVIVTTVLALADTEEYISTSVKIPLVKATAHGIGSAITYGKRYTLMSICGVAPEEDDDGNATVEIETPQYPPTRTIKNAQ